MTEKKKNWKEIPIGGKIIEAGNAEKYDTGSWRTFRPEKNKIKCINCLQCWIFCPDSSTKVEAEKMVGFDYAHCKGCGIRAKVCPVKVIDMKKEER